MFSGIVEAKSRVTRVAQEPGLLRIWVERPSSFDDLREGDSIATNGVCLTVEAFDADSIQFALGAETLRVTGWNDAVLRARPLNLERSLRVGDRVHGHFVTGHVDAMGEIVEVRDLGGSRDVIVRAPPSLAAFVWRKGSWALNGVSLTINDVRDAPGGPLVSHCLIPETLQRTNLEALRPGDAATVEVDSAARAFLRALEAGRLPRKNGDEHDT